MRILVDIRHLRTTNPAGVGRYTENLLNALFDLENKHEYILYSSGRTPSPFGVHASKKHGHVTHIHNATPNKILNLNTLLTKKISFEEVSNIDHIFLPNLNIVNLPKGIPTTLTVHDLSWVHYPQFFSKKMQLWHKLTKPEELTKQVTNIITPSKATAMDLHRTWQTPEHNIQVIPHGIEPEFQHRMQATDHGVRSRHKLPKRFVLFVGTLEPRKNLLATLEALKLYRTQSRDDLHFVMVGNWGWKSHKLRRYLWGNNTESWVHHMGYIPQQELPAFYRSAQATLFPSIYEGFGMPVLESMACGTPVITSHTSSLPEVGADACIYVDPYNIQDIKDAIEQLVTATSLQQQLKRKGVEQAKTFSWKKAALVTQKHFEQTHQ